MVKNYLSLRWVGLLTAIFWLGLDQLTKTWAVSYLTPEPWSIIDGFLNLRLAYNPGVSFSMLSDIAVESMPEILGIFALVVSVVIVHYMSRHGERLTYMLGLGFIAGGAIGNGIDRFVHRAVVDFLDFHYAGWHWPTFNVADIAICLGVVLMLWDAYIESNEIDNGEEKDA